MSVDEISFYCPHCNGKTSCDSALSGQLADCPHCTKQVTIPNSPATHNHNPTVHQLPQPQSHQPQTQYQQVKEKSSKRTKIFLWINVGLLLCALGFIVLSQYSDNGGEKIDEPNALEETVAVDPATNEILHFLNETPLSSNMKEFEGLEKPETFNQEDHALYKMPTEKGRWTFNIGPFIYDPRDKTLNWFVIETSNSSAVYQPPPQFVAAGPQIWLGRARAKFSEWKFFLEKADPIIKISTKNYAVQELKDPLNVLTVKGKIQVRGTSWSKVYPPMKLTEALKINIYKKVGEEFSQVYLPWRNFCGELMDQKSTANPLENEPWGNSTSASLVLPIDKAGRVKNALSDLYQIHGVKPSKY